MFHRVDGFLEAVQTHGMHAIGSATLQRTTPAADNLLERRVCSIQLTARDHVRAAILACSVYLKHGDCIDRGQRFPPPSAWRRSLERGAGTRRARITRLERVPDLQVLDAAAAIHPDRALRFAAFPKMPRTGPDASPGPQGRAARVTFASRWAACAAAHPSVFFPRRLVL